jgi:hypothetical protein
MILPRPILSRLLAMPLCALAADNDRQQPVNLRADRIDIDQKKELSLYHGHVVFSQGTLRLTAALAEVQNRGNAVETVTARGRDLRHRPGAGGVHAASAHWNLPSAASRPCSAPGQVPAPSTATISQRRAAL